MLNNIERNSPEYKAEQEAKAVARAEKEAQTDRMVECMLKVQNSLSIPKSFDAEYSSVIHNVDPSYELDTVMFSFYAKNAFGGEVRKEAMCSFDDQGYLYEYAVL